MAAALEFDIFDPKASISNNLDRSWVSDLADVGFANLDPANIPDLTGLDADVIASFLTKHLKETLVQTEIPLTDGIPNNLQNVFTADGKPRWDLLFFSFVNFLTYDSVDWYQQQTMHHLWENITTVYPFVPEVTTCTQPST